MFLAGPGRVLISHPMVPTSRNQAMVLQFPHRAEPGTALPPAEAGREYQLPSWVAIVWLSGDLIFPFPAQSRACSYSPTWALSVGCPKCPASTWLNEQIEVHQHSHFFHSNRKLNLHTFQVSSSNEIEAHGVKQSYLVLWFWLIPSPHQCCWDPMWH